MVPMFQVVQNRSVCLELRGYAKNIGHRVTRFQGYLSQQIEIPTPKVGPGWDPGSWSQGRERTVEQWR